MGFALLYELLCQVTAYSVKEMLRMLADFDLGL